MKTGTYGIKDKSVRDERHSVWDENRPVRSRAIPYVPVFIPYKAPGEFLIPAPEKEVLSGKKNEAGFIPYRAACDPYTAGINSGIATFDSNLAFSDPSIAAADSGIAGRWRGK